MRGCLITGQKKENAKGEKEPKKKLRCFSFRRISKEEVPGESWLWKQREAINGGVAVFWTELWGKVAA